MELFYVSLVFALIVMLALLAFHFYHSHTLTRLLEQKMKNFQQEVLRSDIMSFYREMESYAALLERRINEYRALSKQLDEKFSHYAKMQEEEKPAEAKTKSTKTKKTEAKDKTETKDVAQEKNAANIKNTKTKSTKTANAAEATTDKKPVRKARNSKTTTDTKAKASEKATAKASSVTKTETSPSKTAATDKPKPSKTTATEKTTKPRATAKSSASQRKTSAKPAPKETSKELTKEEIAKEKTLSVASKSNTKPTKTISATKAAQSKAASKTNTNQRKTSAKPVSKELTKEATKEPAKEEEISLSKSKDTNEDEKKTKEEPQANDTKTPTQLSFETTEEQTLQETLDNMQEQTLQMNTKQHSSIKNLQERIIELSKETEEKDIEKENFLDEAFSQMTQEQELNQLLWSDWRNQAEENIKEVKAVEVESLPVAGQESKDSKLQSKKDYSKTTVSPKKEKNFLSIVRNVGKAIRPILIKDEEKKPQMITQQESSDHQQVQALEHKEKSNWLQQTQQEEEIVDFSFLQQIKPKVQDNSQEQQLVVPTQREQALNKAKDAFLPQEKSITPDKISNPENFDYRQTQTYRMLEEMNQKQKKEEHTEVEIIRPVSEPEKLKHFTKEAFSSLEKQKNIEQSANHLIEKKVSPAEFSHLIQNLQAGQKRADSLSQLMGSGFTLSEIENLSGVSYSELNLIRSLYNL